jgi:lipoyl(octanoyl) transferase
MRDTTIAPDTGAVDWFVSDRLVDYEQAVSVMHARSAAIASGSATELVWLLEHPPLYTAGTSARAEDLLAPGRFPVHRTGRGGQLTYHGPGQRVAYVMLNLARRGGDVRAFVCALESWIIGTLAAFGIRGEMRDGRVGVWVRRDSHGENREDKIAAIGLRLRRWVSLHGLSLNVAPDLEHFSGIVPCGLRGYGVTSFADLGVHAQMPEVDLALRIAFEQRFGLVRHVRALTELAPLAVGASDMDRRL